MPTLIVYLLQQEQIIIIANIDIEKRLLNKSPPNPEDPRKNLTIATFEKLISNDSLLNLIPANTAQKIQTPIKMIIKLINFWCFFIGSIRE